MTRVLRITLIALALAGCQSPTRVFEAHVYSGPGLQLLQAERVSCMHCPYFFSMRATGPALAAILRRHELREFDRLPECLERGHELGTRNFTWWGLEAESNAYGACYRSDEPGHEPEFRLLIVTNDRALFATSLNFDEKTYKRTR